MVYYEALDRRFCLTAYERPNHKLNQVQKEGNIRIMACTNNCNCKCCGTEATYDCTPGKYDFTIQKGTSLDLALVYTNCEGTAIDLTGFFSKMSAQYDEHTFILNTNIVSPTEGKINIVMSPYETSNIYTIPEEYTNCTDYTYQLDITSSGKKVYRIMTGTIHVVPECGC